MKKALIIICKILFIASVVVSCVFAVDGNYLKACYYLLYAVLFEVQQIGLSKGGAE